MAERRAAGEPEPEPDTSMIDEYNAEMERLNELEDKRRGVIHQTTVSSGSVPPGSVPPSIECLGPENYRAVRGVTCPASLSSLD